MWLANSTDGGATWSNVKISGQWLPGTDKLRLCYFNYIPVVVMDYSTATYVSNLTASGWGNPIYLSGSWGFASCTVNSKYLFIATGNNTGYSPLLWNSSGGLQTFTKKTVNTVLAYNQWKGIANKSDTLYMVFTNQSALGAGWSIDGYWFLNSTDNGETWSSPISIGSHNFRGYNPDYKTFPELFIDGNNFGLCYAMDFGEGYQSFLTSADSGATWSSEKKVADTLATSSGTFLLPRQNPKCMFYGSDVLFSGTWRTYSDYDVAMVKYAATASPSNPYVDVGNNGNDWTYGGTFTETLSPQNVSFAASLTSVIGSCTCTDCTILGGANCSVPVTVGTASRGKLAIDNMMITYSTQAAPSVTNVNVNATNNFTLDDLNCNGTYSDPNSDPESGSTYRWFTNQSGTWKTISGQTSKLMDSDYTNETSWYICEYTPSDGSLYGTPVNSSALQIVPLTTFASYSGTFTELGSLTVNSGGNLSLGQASRP